MKIRREKGRERPKKKCTGCGKDFSIKEMDAHIMDIIRSLRV